MRQRGYSNKFVEQQLQRVDGIKRNELLTDNAQRKKKREKKDRVPLVIKDMKNIPDIGENKDMIGVMKDRRCQGYEKHSGHRRHS